MDPIKEAFFKVREDINFLKEQISEIKEKLSLLEKSFSNNQNITKETTQNTANGLLTADKTAHSTALPYEIKGLLSQNFIVSTRNQGVPTDKPTDRQINQQTDKTANNFLKSVQNKEISSIDELKKAQELLDSLDSIKKEFRLKFKNLTNREMLLYTTIYSLEEQGIEEVTYRLLANHLNLTESSIRDYANKLILKKIPLFKIKQKNKQVFLSIPKDFKNMISLPTLLKLREI